MAKNPKDAGKNPQNDKDLPQHRGDQHTAPNQPPGTYVEGPEADARRRAEQSILAKNQRDAAEPGEVDRKARHEALDRLEKELVRHETKFEDYTGGLLYVEPHFQPEPVWHEGNPRPEDWQPKPHTPMSIHQMRVDALRVQNNPDAHVTDIDKAAEALRAIRFVAPATVTSTESNGSGSST